MEKIYFDSSTFIWKKKLNLKNNKDILLKEVYSIIKYQPENTTDGFIYREMAENEINFTGEIKIQTKLDEILQLSINSSKEIHDATNKKYNKLNINSWINVVRSINPIQPNFKEGNEKYHTHTDIQEKAKKYIPDYTYVYYIQMPDVMSAEDGVLYFKGKNEKEYWIRPEEDDLIIMPADIPHAPNNAPNANIDRIVLAGNVGFNYIKKEKTLF
jgi:cupin superfamily acireductone dioxygenase involved in methionine salvage